MTITDRYFADTFDADGLPYVFDSQQGGKEVRGPFETITQAEEMARNLNTPLTVNRPVPFPGTPEQARRNYFTHDWITYDPEEVPECGRCMAKTWHVAASYPCGEEPPRETYTVGGEAA